MHRDDELLYAFRRNVVVAASAGTGKTYRLTALYVLLTLGLTSRGQRDARTAAPPIGPDRIVATTFSRAAAREIAHRVEDALSALAVWDGAAPAPFADVLRARQDALGLRLDASEVRARAADAIAAFRSARIDTLHGVARRIVDAYAVALGIPPGATILDEEEATALGDAAVDEALGDALSEGGARAAAARDLVTACGGLGPARRETLRLIERLDEEGIGPRDLAIADHTAAARSRWIEVRRAIGEAAISGSGALREAASLAWRAIAASGDPHRADPALGEAAERAIAALWTTRAPGAATRTAADEALLDIRRSIGGVSDSLSVRARKLLALLRSAAALAPRESGIIDVLDDVRRRVFAARRQRRALAFGDLLRVARDGLRDHPDVARAVRQSLHVLLVDEFQDTSRVQRDLVYLLRERDEAAAARSRSELPRPSGIETHGLFIVGDRKQSIYGFRGADVSVFASVCAELAGEAAGASLGLPRASWSSEPCADFVALRESRRSGPRVLAFVNAFAARDFAHDADAPRDFEVAYGEAEHLVAPLDRPDDAPEGEVVVVEDDGDLSEQADAFVRDATGAAREAIVAAAYVDREVRVLARATWRDVAILARRRSTIPLIEIALARRDVPYVVAGRALYEAVEVRDLAALLRLVLDPRDRLALPAVLRGPAVALSDAALAALSVPGRGLSVPLLDRTEPEAASRLDKDERARLARFRARFQALRRAALRLLPAEAIRACIEAFDVDRVLAALPRAAARLGNLERLESIARTRGGTLASFVRYLDRRIREQTDEAEAAVFAPEDDAVRLTTIHASKGLDFPVVVLVDLNAEPRAQSSAVTFGRSEEGAPTLLVRHFEWETASAVRAAIGPEAAAAAIATELVAVATPAFEAAYAERRARERAERERLTYVAMTRARRSLVLVGPTGPARAGSAWRSLATGLRDAELAATIARRESAKELLAIPACPRSESPPAVSPRAEPRATRRLPVLAEARAIAIATTPLALFAKCPRRFRFRMLLGLDEPVASGQLDLFEAPADAERESVDDGADPRALGRAAHRVLERWPATDWGEPPDPNALASLLANEGVRLGSADAARIGEALTRFLGGAYARRLRASAAALRREQRFVVAVRGDVELALRGAIDLLAVPPDGPVDVIDYKRSRPRADAAPFAFQLRAYALAARRFAPERPIRAGVVYLGTEAPVWLSSSSTGALGDADHAAFEDELGELARRFARARATDRWDGIELAGCRAQRCGFVGVCHAR